MTIPRSPSSPPALQANVAGYFTLMDGDDRAETGRVFAPNAEVTDDGHTYRGSDAITGWLNGAASEYETTSRTLSISTAPDTAEVVVRLEGNFPGGRVDLRHTFTLDGNGLIVSLVIAP